VLGQVSRGEGAFPAQQGQYLAPVGVRDGFEKRLRHLISFIIRL
jgi:hypothetical protein